MIIPAAAIFNPDGPLWSWSNFAIYRLSFEGISYPSLEHYFQASKFSNTSTLDAIRQSATPAEAKALGWKFDSEKRLDWETVRYMIMKKAIKTKCSQWNRFRQQLISSYPFPIIESNVADPVWGIGEDFMGQNLWGKCAMEIRAELLHLATPNSNIQISTHTRFDKQSNWILFRGSDWSVAPAIVADESLILTEIGVMARDIVELVEQYLSRHRTSVKIPRWSNEPHYLYNSGTLRLDRDSKVQISRKVFDAARAFAYQCKYETFTEDADSRSCIPGWHERFLEIISAELKRSIALPILVIGAGVGDEAKRIWRQFGTDTLLSDVSDGLVENCMRQAPYADLRVGVAEDLSDIRSQSIGSYIALRTLESMFLDKMATLKEAYRVLKVGGMIAISISCAYNENGILQKGRFVSANERDLAGGSEEVLDILRNMESVGLCPLRIYDLETEWLIIGERPRRPSSS